MNNAFLGFILALTEAKKGNIPEDKAKDIAMKSSIGSFIPNNLITPLLVAKEMTTAVQQNGTLQTEVNNRINPRRVAVRLNTIFDMWKDVSDFSMADLEPFCGGRPNMTVQKCIGAAILRVAFSNSDLKLLRNHSPEAIQEIIDISLKMPDPPVPKPASPAVPIPFPNIKSASSARSGTTDPKSNKS
jgi:hypothetical protein